MKGRVQQVNNNNNASYTLEYSKFDSLLNDKIVIHQFEKNKKKNFRPQFFENKRNINNDVKERMYKQQNPNNYPDERES